MLSPWDRRSKEPSVQARWAFGWCVVGMVLTFALVGCHHHKKASPTSAPVFTAHDDFNSPLVQARMPRLKEELRQTQLVAPPTPSLAVTAGSLPLVYLTTQAGSVRIVDDADKSTVFSGPIVANTTIAVNAATGVLIGGKRVVSYPLPSDHKYSIYLETDSGPSMIQQGTIRPGGAMPATLPSVQH